MIYIAACLLVSVLGMRHLWMLFLATMNLNEAKNAGQLHGFALWAGYTVLAEGLLWDAFIQFTVASVLWCEPPREWTVSGRVARLCAGPDGWRKDRAVWFRDTLLKLFDRSGGHG